MNRYLPLLMTLALAGCGGGGGGSTPPATTASAPTTTTTPGTPTPNSAVGQNGTFNGTALQSPQANPAGGPFPLQAITANFDTTNGGLNTADAAVPGNISLTFNPDGTVAKITYAQNGTDHELTGLDGGGVNGPTTISTDGSGSGIAPNNQLSVSKITKEMIQNALINLKSNQPVVINEALTWSTFGVWATAFNNNGGPHDGQLAAGVYAAGSLTPANAVPTTGSATYTGDAAGFASVPTPAGDTTHTQATLNGTWDSPMAITADFGKQTATASLSNPQFISGDPQGTKVALPSLTSTTGTLSGNTIKTDLAGGGLTGNVSANFFGPAAQEVAGTLTASGAGINMNGAFGLKK
jgi:hypothetical protein